MKNLKVIKMILMVIRRMGNNKIVEIFTSSLESADIPLEAKEKISLEFLKKLTEVKRGGNNKRVGSSKSRQ